MWHCVRELELIWMMCARRLECWVAFTEEMDTLMAMFYGKESVCCKEILDKPCCQMRQSACFVGNIPIMQFCWGIFKYIVKVSGVYMDWKDI